MRFHILSSCIFISLITAGCQSSTELLELRTEISVLNKKIETLEKDGSFSILFVGDIILVNHTKKLMKANGLDYPFRKIQPQLSQFDFVIGNLETPITRRGTPVRDRFYIFRLNPSLAKSLTTINLSGVTLGNNHLFDYGPEGVYDTIQNLENLGIKFSGAGPTLEEARRPITLESGMIKVYILSYCGRPPDRYYAGNDRPGTAPMDMKIITEDINKYKKHNNVVIVSLHWGIEQTHMIQKDQISLAHEIINQGADAIVGHHPHWPQGIEIYRQKPIIYSLGNFVNGHLNKIEKDNIITAFYFKKSSLTSIEVMSIAGKNREIKFQPYIIKDNRAKTNLSLIQNLSKSMKLIMDIVGYKGLISIND